jgi:hypothetical protein
LLGTLTFLFLLYKQGLDYYWVLDIVWDFSVNVLKPSSKSRIIPFNMLSPK